MQKHTPQRALIPLLSPTHAATCCCLCLCPCAHALSRQAALALFLSLTARSFSVGVAALRPAFFVFAKHVNFCVYFLIFVCASVRCFCFLAACCWRHCWRRCWRLLLQCFCFYTALSLLCLCLCLCLCSGSACCFALHFHS